MLAIVRGALELLLGEVHLVATQTLVVRPREWVVILVNTHEPAEAHYHRSTDSSGEQVGTIQRVMIDKLSGKVAYAVPRSSKVENTFREHLWAVWSLPSCSSVFLVKPHPMGDPPRAVKSQQQ
jgi:hypothetical protein